ncbi:SRPBCC family protein [Aestuariibacter halophilus]|uniref:SRPBCC family protein n=1 Tax=Fluctibacter halophilus TaxID=226011 RepID=A0ABS8G6Z9_9ALTE|nr:SRPBCC family protein [Aestuariibacter halophilus]MCC2615846.1 SRPBCC family protein [Aestuariibacter halophilus]
MGAVKKLLILVISLFIVLLVIGFMLPSTFKVERTITIDAPASEIYPLVVDLQAWQQWGVWFQRDPQMEVSYTGPDSEVGMRSSWSSESEGSGTMEIIAAETDKRVVYTLYFPDFEMGSTGELVLQPQGDSTVVTWMDYGDVGSNPINHYFAAMMDSMVGPDFEAGLENLKTLSENPR